MLFHSLQFGVFFSIVFSAYLVLPHMWQNRMLLLASYVFYGAWDWRYLSLLIASTVVDYLCGIQLERSEAARERKTIVAVSAIVNLSFLGTFKYFDFFATNFQILMGNFGLEVHPYFLHVALPIGISFYTFQSMSYTIDVYRGKLKAARNPFDFALYVAYFPQLIAGPIERGTRLLPQILAPRKVTWEGFARGAYLFMWGIFLKVFIADNLADIADPVFESGAPYDGGNVLLAVYAFSFQIYCDFAGYSFMAIGLGKSMGIELMENFRRPYFSKNISDFWRRWHISLSSWFRDYVFSPFYMFLSRRPLFSRLSMKWRHGVAFFIALMVAEYMLGLWHGAGWNFGLFGLYHGLAIWLYYAIRKYWDRMNSFLQILLTYHVACGGWLVFRASSLDQVAEMFQAMLFDFSFAPELGLATTALTIAGLTVILITVQIFQDLKQDTYVVFRLPAVFRLSFVSLMVVLVLVFGNFSDRPFIYFQF